ncbi:MAG: carbon starvation protein A [Deltaproteobacteria bacterium]|nr:carbon starvation protein A [Deltaproteobacteria bacterium]
MVIGVVGAGCLAFIIAYRFYGRMLTRLFGLGGDEATPAHTLSDGRDFHPARRAVLLGHHFSSIAGAGPIVGPIFATLVFGWLPAVLWIIIGSIFIGGVHDLGALALSVKNGAQSIAQVARQQLSPLASKLFLAFVWLALVYVLAVFVDLTAGTFAPPSAAGTTSALNGGAVATSSILFIVLAVALGLTLRRRPRLSLLWASAIFVPLVFVAVYLGQRFPTPIDAAALGGLSPKHGWSLLLLAYCFVASVTPVWALLQPRDYLSSFLLYACLGGGLIGILLASINGDSAAIINYPAFRGFHADNLGYLFPALFITIACGACSGFHSIVASGTTAKQLDRRRDALAIGYGSMLIEGMLALISVATVTMLSVDNLGKQSPTALFAQGLGRFFASWGLPGHAGTGFALLALSTFLLTTLDTATRLGRYVLEELAGLKGNSVRWLSTSLTLALPTLFSLLTFSDAKGNPVPTWKIIWPVFGATNQLLGALALMVISVWLKQQGRRVWVSAVPMLFMLSATLLALIQLVAQYRASLIGIIATLLLALAVVLIVEAARSLFGQPAPRSKATT